MVNVNEVSANLVTIEMEQRPRDVSIQGALSGKCYYGPQMELRAAPEQRQVGTSQDWVVLASENCGQAQVQSSVPWPERLVGH